MYRTIVVGTDGSETAQRAVDQATELAQAMEAELHVVSAYEPVGGRIAGAPEGAAKVWAVAPDYEVEGVVDQALSTVRERGVEAKAHTVKGDPVDALLEVAERVHADLIVVGNRGMHGLGRVLGSVPNKVSHRARCSVLIVATAGD
jgi:nucleotide-binding universal stress UspA family protein